jgi:hypothetical protein
MASRVPPPRQNLYGSPQGLVSNLFPVIIAKRDPTSADTGHYQGQFWLNELSGAMFFLGLVAGGVATWTSVSGSITLPITVPNGGTGAITLTNRGVLIGQGTSAVTATAAGTAGQPLLSGGGGANPAYGTLGTAFGGTNIDGSSAANGRLLIGNGTGYTLANLTAGSNVTITNGAGSISIASSGGTAPGSTCNFQAYLNANATNVTGDGTTVTIPFDNTRWNVGSAITGSNFTVPVGATGKYMMNVQLTLSDLDAAYTRLTLQLQASSNTYTLLDIRPGTALPTGGIVATLSASTFADFLVGGTSTAFLTLTISGGTKTVDILGGVTGTLWSGFYVGT